MSSEATSADSSASSLSDRRGLVHRVGVGGRLSVRSWSDSPKSVRPAYGTRTTAPTAASDSIASRRYDRRTGSPGCSRLERVVGFAVLPHRRASLNRQPHPVPDNSAMRHQRWDPPIGHNLPGRGPVGIVACRRRQRRRPSGRHRPRLRRRRLARRHRARPLARGARAGHQRRSRSCTAAASTARRRSPAGGAGSRSTGSSTRRTCGSTGPTSATPRATSSPTASTSPRSPASGDHHVLAVEVACNDEQGTRGRRNITGLFQHSEAVDRDWNPGGLWRPVLLYDTGPAKLDRLRVLCRDADESRAHVRLYARIDSDAARTVRLRTTADGVTVGETEHPLAAGVNEIEWALDLDRPQLWWPRALGRPAAHRDRRRAARRRRGQRSPVPPHRPARGRLDRLGVLDQRRAAVPEGCQRAAHPAGPGRRRSQGGAPGRRARRRGRASTCCACRRTSPTTSSTAPRTSSASWCCRTSRCSGATPARSGERPCARLGRRSTRSATTPRSCSGAPTTSPSPTPPRSSRRRAAGGSGGSSPTSSRRGTRPSSTAGSSGRSRRPTRRDPPSPTVACSPTSPSSTGPTAICGSGWHRGETGELAELARTRASAGPFHQ